MQTVRNMFGWKTQAQKAAEANQTEAMNTQQRAANSAMEDSAVTRSQQSASGRLIRGTGRRALAFMGSELGVQDSLAATGPA